MCLLEVKKFVGGRTAPLVGCMGSNLAIPKEEASISNKLIYHIQREQRSGCRETALTTSSQQVEPTAPNPPLGHYVSLNNINIS